jgi:hypothetical protein
MRMRELLSERRRPDPWRRARSLADLADLTRRWLLGDPEVPYHPNGYDELDPESEPIRGHLAALNRAGFLTECSQPALPPTTGWDGATYEQRAAVQGFTDRETADRIEAICREEGLTCIRHSGAGRRIDYSTAQDCTWRDGRPVRDFGARLGRREVRLCMSGHGERELRNAEQITVIDPDPQPSDRLFTILAGRLASARTPAIDTTSEDNGYGTSRCVESDAAVLDSGPTVAGGVQRQG